MRTGIFSIPWFFALALLAGCQQDQTSHQDRITISDIQQVTQEMTDKLAMSDFLKDRNSQSPPIVITCRKAENLSMDLVEEPELWMFVAKIETSINSTDLCRSKNITFQIPPERVAMLRKRFPDIASGAATPTHIMTCSIRSANRVTNNAEGYVNGETRLYYFDYNITRLDDGAVQWNGSAEFKRDKAGIGID